MVKKIDAAPINARSVAVKATWENPETAAARAKRHHVIANGIEYKSTGAAFAAFGFNEKNRHIGFRVRLVKSKTGNLSFAGIPFTLKTVGG